METSLDLMMMTTTSAPSRLSLDALLEGCDALGSWDASLARTGHAMKARWADVCTWAAQHEAPEQALWLLEQATSRWPAEACPAPQAWVTAAAQGAPGSALRLARRVSCDISGMKASAIATLLSHPSLRHVEIMQLRGGALGDEVARALAASPWRSRLRELSLESMLLGDEGARALADCGHLSQLEALSLRANQLTDTGVIALLARPQFAALRALYLDANALGDVSARAIAISSVARNLRELGLSQNATLGPAGAGALRDRLSVGLYRLESLELSGCALPEAQAQALSARVKRLANTRQMA